MNLDVLRERLQNLFQKNIVDLNCSQQVSSYSDPTHEVLPTLGFTQSCNSDAVYPPYDHFNNDFTGYDPMVAGRNDQFCFLKGNLLIPSDMFAAFFDISTVTSLSSFPSRIT